MFLNSWHIIRISYTIAYLHWNIVNLLPMSDTITLVSSQVCTDLVTDLILSHLLHIFQTCIWYERLYMYIKNNCRTSCWNRQARYVLLLIGRISVFSVMQTSYWMPLHSVIDMCSVSVLKHNISFVVSQTFWDISLNYHLSIWLLMKIELFNLLSWWCLNVIQTFLWAILNFSLISFYKTTVSWGVGLLRPIFYNAFVRSDIQIYFSKGNFYVASLNPVYHWFLNPMRESFRQFLPCRPSC